MTNPIMQQPAVPMPEAHITRTMTSDTSLLADAVETAFQRALKRDGKMIEALLTIPGMSGQLYRYFINNLIEIIPNPRYLEVGSWAGSTMCAAIFANQLRAFCIDDWSQFGGPVKHFMQHVGVCMTDKVQFNMLTSDFRAVDYTAIGKFNVYLFDGPHGEKDQYDGIMIALPALDDEFILIVDDWNWEHVRQGTLRAIEDCRLDVAGAIELRTTLDNSHPDPAVSRENSDWHNGYYIAVLHKKKA